MSKIDLTLEGSFACVDFEDVTAVHFFSTEQWEVFHLFLYSGGRLEFFNKDAVLMKGKWLEYKASKGTPTADDLKLIHRRLTTLLEGLDSQ